jgi:hypothetical protein
VDADSCGNRDTVYSEDPNLSKCRMGYVIMYCGCPILWDSRLQSAFALNTMESNYVARLAALQDVIPVMHLLKEMQDQGCHVEDTLSIKCQLFEDNSGILEQAKTAKSQPRTLHINTARQPFPSDVENDLIQIHCI